MTTIQEVEISLLEIIDYKIASEWIKNDIIKMKIAQGYDDWMNDIHDHKMTLSLTEYIESLLDTPGYFEHQNTPLN